MYFHRFGSTDLCRDQLDQPRVQLGQAVPLPPRWRSSDCSSAAGDVTEVGRLVLVPGVSPLSRLRPGHRHVRKKVRTRLALRLGSPEGPHVWIKSPFQALRHHLHLELDRSLLHPVESLVFVEALHRVLEQVEAQANVIGPRHVALFLVCSRNTAEYDLGQG